MRKLEDLTIHEQEELYFAALAGEESFAEERERLDLGGESPGLYEALISADPPRGSGTKMLYWRATMKPGHGPDACASCGITSGSLPEEIREKDVGRDEIGEESAQRVDERMYSTGNCHRCGRLLWVVGGVEVRD